MHGIFRKQPWYVAGLAFECAQCGQCCAGPGEGYVWVSRHDIEAIAQFLGMPADRFDDAYVRQVEARYSLIEHQPSNDCVFLARPPDGTPHCMIYPVRPAQCRSWPFWTSNLRDPESWALASLRCVGINRGPRFPCDEIETRRKATSE